MARHSVVFHGHHAVEVIYLALAAVLSGCVPSTPSPVSPQMAPTSSTTIPFHPAASLSPSDSPTTPAREATPTQSRKLSLEEQSGFWLNAVSSNLGCDLPCWWGLVPGKSTWQDLGTLFLPLGGMPLPRRDSPQMSRLDFYIAVAPYTPPTRQPATFAVIELRGLITGIDAEFALHHASYTFAPLDGAAERYSLSGLLQSASVPTRVFVALQSEPSEAAATWVYDIWLYYAERGITASYEGEGLSKKGQSLQVCPSYGGTTKSASTSETHHSHLRSKG